MWGEGMLERWLEVSECSVVHYLPTYLPLQFLRVRNAAYIYIGDEMVAMLLFYFGLFCFKVPFLLYCARRAGLGMVVSY